MRLTLERFGEQIFVQGQWASIYSQDHSKAVWEDMPAEIQEHARALLAWADSECEPKLAAEITGYERRRQIDRDIALLNEVRKTLDK